MEWINKWRTINAIHSNFHELASAALLKHKLGGGGGGGGDDMRPGNYI